MSQLYDSVLAPTGLRATQRAILATIARAGGATLGKVAASLVLDHSALGHNLRPLVRDGFVVLDIDPDDRRSRLARLTKSGENKLNESNVLWEVAQRRFENKFGIAKAKALRETLDFITMETFDDLREMSVASSAVRRRPKSRSRK